MEGYKIKGKTMVRPYSFLKPSGPIGSTGNNKALQSEVRSAKGGTIKWEYRVQEESREPLGKTKSIKKRVCLKKVEKNGKEVTYTLQQEWVPG